MASIEDGTLWSIKKLSIRSEAPDGRPERGWVAKSSTIRFVVHLKTSISLAEKVRNPGSSTSRRKPIGRSESRSDADCRYSTTLVRKARKQVSNAARFFALRTAF